MKLVTKYYKGEAASTFNHWYHTSVDKATNRVHYHRRSLPCYATPSTTDPFRYRFEGSIAACEGELPRLPTVKEALPPPPSGPAPPPAVIDFTCVGCSRTL